MATWIPANKALQIAPMSSGIYKIGIRRRSSYIETLYIGVTKTGGSIRETLLKLFSGVEGDQRLMDYVSSAWNKRHLKIDWSVQLHPKDSIGDTIRWEIARYRRVPEFNKKAADDHEPYIIKEWNLTNPPNFK